MVQVIAHRGASAYAPENTLASFELASSMGSDWFELDCTLSKDGEVVVIHDDNVDRVSDGRGKVSEKTLAELKRLDAGAWKDPRFAGERIPTLDETLAFAKEHGIGVYIEVKSSHDEDIIKENIVKLAGSCEALTQETKSRILELIRSSDTPTLELATKTIDLVRKHRMEDKVVIQSFSPIVCLIALAEVPRIRSELLGCRNKDKPEEWKLLLRWLDWMRPDGFNIDIGGVDKQLVDYCHGRGMTMAVWTVDVETDIQRIARWGVDRIITNRPDACLKLLKGPLKNNLGI
ncbi:MAG: glycerophosphodiester phosphodiesterase family protein [Victivallales bacterium]